MKEEEEEEEEEEEGKQNNQKERQNFGPFVVTVVAVGAFVVLKSCNLLKVKSQRASLT